MAEFHAQRKSKILQADENADKMNHNLLDFIHFQNTSLNPLPQPAATAAGCRAVRQDVE
jgi:hypothetical protein